MYEIKLPLSPKAIELFVTPYDIFSNYIAKFPGINVPFHSQLRTGDMNPSCRVSAINGVLRYKDFSQKNSLSCYNYVMEKYNLSFHNALGKIRNDFNLEQIEEYRGIVPITAVVKMEEQPVITNRKDTIILKKARSWQLQDKEFWFDRYGITQDWLNQANIEPISSFWLDNDRFEMREFVCPKHSYAYNYYWHNNVFRRKIYQPFSEYKWLSNVDSTIVQGWDMIPKSNGEILIITSSFKDAGTIWCNLTVDTIGKQVYAIAPNNEETFIPESVYNKLKSRWKHILLWYDNDFTKEYNVGLERSKQISEQYGIPFLMTPDGTYKDPSDFRHHLGKDEFISMTLKQLNGYL